jgi:hypothetical protein
MAPPGMPGTGNSELHSNNSPSFHGDPYAAFIAFRRGARSHFHTGVFPECSRQAGTGSGYGNGSG